MTMENSIFAKFDDYGFPIAFWQSAAYDEPEKVIPVDATEITQEQFNELFEFQGLRKWVDGGVIIYTPPALEPVIPDSVSRRQFKMQLAIMGFSAQVSSWVAAQPELVQIAFNESGSFNRSDVMLQQGFAGLGFAVEQVDQFFVAAALL